MIWRPDSDPPSDPRQRMIAQTSAFLTWALAEDRGLPRIPRQRVDRGGFSGKLDTRVAKAAVAKFWSRTLNVVADRSR